MSYVYRRRTRSQLKTIAGKILARFPKRRIGEFAIDIEGIQEDFDLEIIFRPGLGLDVAGYIARDPRYIVLNELALVYWPRARFTIAEEVCHKILEWNLWRQDQIPEGARAHELSNIQYRSIEQDARNLAAEILEPEAIFRQRFEHHRLKFEQAASPGLPIRTIAQALGDEFIVSSYAAGVRAYKLGMITKLEYSDNFPLLF